MCGRRPNSVLPNGDKRGPGGGRGLIGELSHSCHQHALHLVHHLHHQRGHGGRCLMGELSHNFILFYVTTTLTSLIIISSKVQLSHRLAKGSYLPAKLSSTLITFIITIMCYPTVIFGWANMHLGEYSGVSNLPIKSPQKHHSTELKCFHAT